MFSTGAQNGQTKSWLFPGYNLRPHNQILHTDPLNSHDWKKTADWLFEHVKLILKATAGGSKHEQKKLTAVIKGAFPLSSIY